MKKFAFFPGCLIPARHPAMEFAIRATLEKLAIEIVDLEGASCCPDPIYFKSKDKVSWLAVAARNLTLAELDPAIQYFDQPFKDWMPRSSRGMTWVGIGASWYQAAVGTGMPARGRVAKGVAIWSSSLANRPAPISR